MSFDKRYPNRKDRRRPYHGVQAVDPHCRPGGLCPWCREGRLKASRLADAAFRQDLRDFDKPPPTEEELAYEQHEREEHELDNRLAILSATGLPCLAAP